MISEREILFLHLSPGQRLRWFLQKKRRILALGLMVVDDNRFPFRKLIILFQGKMTPAACFYQDQLEALGSFGNVWLQKGGLCPDQD